jgi:AraC-like DNA-binding protein
MEFNVIHPGSEKIEIFAGLPEVYNGRRLPWSERYAGASDFGKMSFQQYSGNGFTIWLSDYHFTKNVQLLGRADVPVLELHIQFRNYFNLRWDGFDAGVQRPYQYNLSYVPFVNSMVSFDADKSCRTFDIHFTLDYLQRLASSSSKLAGFMELVDMNRPSQLLEHTRFLTPEMIGVINSIIQSDFNDRLFGLFVESKILELLVLILDAATEETNVPPIKLSSYDIEMLHEAKRLLLSDFEQKMSLQQLARSVGINEFKLKKGFKHLFGDTVFGYRHTVRMDKAKQILLETKLDISDVAFMTGFEYSGNFEKAFKKFHGFTPAELRKYGRVK